MKIKLHSNYIKIFSVISIAWAQQQYISPEDIKNEWRNYTSFQKQ